MIISASRRTDIPAFYSKWFMNRIREGYCVTINPFNRNQKTRISLHEKDVDVIVFWTKYANPLLKYLNELNSKGFKYYFQYTLTPYDRNLEKNVPSIEKRIETFLKLSTQIGKDRVIWRYDPIIFSQEMLFEYHLEKFATISEKLAGYSNRVVISIVDYYRKTKKNLKEYNDNLIIEPEKQKEFGDFFLELSKISSNTGFEITSCSEIFNLIDYGIKPGKCIDDNYIKAVFNIDVINKKDPNQRKECGCVVSKDIGAYNTCLFNCLYCYSTYNYKQAKEKHEHHNKNDTSLEGNIQIKTKQNKKKKSGQFELFES